MPNRNELMSLSTIPNKKWNASSSAGVAAVMSASGRDDFSDNLRTNDIDGAKPRLQGYRFSQKESYANRSDDIEGSKPKTFYKPVNYGERLLATNDIEGSKPIPKNHFKTTRSPGNPLDPQYKLPTVEQRAVTPPKFIRNNMAVDDIDKAQPNRYHRFLGRKTNDISDIDGASPKSSQHRTSDRPNLMDVKDINYDQRSPSAGRGYNPLDPVYETTDEYGRKIKIGAIDGSKPKALPKKRQNPSSSLNTNDIAGATSGTKGVGPAGKNRRDYRKTNDISDLAGASAGSLKKCRETTRCTNPLDPTYSLIGDQETKTHDEIAQRWQKSTTTTKPKVDTKSLSYKANESQFYGLDVNSNYTEAERAQLEKSQYRKNYANFHGIDPPKTGTSDANYFPKPRFQQTAKKQFANREVAIPRKLKEDPDFKDNLNQFYGVGRGQSPKREFERNQELFYRGPSGENGGDKKFQDVAERAEKKRLQGKGQQEEEIRYFDVQDAGYKQSVNNFYAAAGSSRGSACADGAQRVKGSYQNDVENFYGVDSGANGQIINDGRPTQFYNASMGHHDQRAKKKTQSVTRVDSRDSNYQGNQASFWGEKRMVDSRRQFQKNAEKFFEGDDSQPHDPEKFKNLNKLKWTHGKPVATQDPKYKKNAANFYGVEERRLVTPAQKMSKFIGR
eukprot:CAMPEP_0114998538 /NCGR_PEP_ID=MMETSP0216-20121206/15566_1 /TAXON_ID=223996 /ORGANISM="Protocruzia adherens, Strain Boccale" /LENGTH=672 /DNA_ID=CAMNT_0002363153 /DNA_START=143 /DNA_END=2162 /DNA_ORIENTATION=+